MFHAKPLWYGALLSLLSLCACADDPGSGALDGPARNRGGDETSTAPDASSEASPDARPGELPPDGSEPPPPSGEEPMGQLGPQAIGGDGTDGDLYVAADGSDSNPGTLASPLKTVKKAAQLAKPGDVVYVRGGKYPGFDVRNVSGTAAAPITFRAFPGEQPVIDGYLGNVEQIALLVYGDSNHLVFDGFEILDSNPQVEEVRKLDLSKAADAKTFEDVWVPKLTSTFVRGIRVSPADGKTTVGITFRNMRVHHLVELGVSVNSSTSDVTIENSHLYDLGHPRSGYGVYLHGKNFVFRNNIVHDATYGLHIYGKSSEISGTIVENNYFYNIGLRAYWHMSSARVKPTGGAGILLDDPGSAARVVNNIVRNCQTGIRVNLPGSLVAHNLVYDSKAAGIALGATGVELINNVIHSNGTDVSGTPGKNVGEVSANTVELVDVAHPEKGTSGLEAVRDKGVAISGIAKDILGRDRVLGAAPDPGPFELAP